jgi:hypothetical protein
MSTHERIDQILSLIDEVLDDPALAGRPPLAGDEIGDDGADLRAEAA